MFKYEILEKLDKTKRYKLACGHNNIGILNLWPFKTWVCLECGFKTERIEEKRKDKMDKEKRDHLLNRVGKALDVQFEMYSWENMIDDIPDLTDEDKKWVKENICYKAYIL